jgi:hypothetical protein
MDAVIPFSGEIPLPVEEMPLRQRRHSDSSAHEGLQLALCKTCTQSAEEKPGQGDSPCKAKLEGLSLPMITELEPLVIPQFYSTS